MFIGATVVAALLPTGCSIRNIIPGWPKPPEPCVLSEYSTKNEIVAHINQRATKLVSWKCSDATISSSSMPMRLDAHIAVERPKNFRLVVSSTVTGNEADFGANAERIWFWMRRDESKKIFTVRHDQLETIERRLPIPFRPDWLMEALGVIPLDPEKVRMLPRQPGDKMARLLSREYTPSGRIVRRVTVVDCCNGNVVSQTLQDDTNGRVLMKADFNSFQVERHSGLKLPYRIDLQWPQTKMTMTLRLGTIQVNPAEFAPKTWQLPTYAGCATFDLGRGLAVRPRPRGNRPAEHRQPADGRVRIQPLRHETPQFEEDKGQRPVQPIPPFRQEAGTVTPIGGTAPTSQEPGPFAKPFPGTQTADRPHFADE